MQTQANIHKVLEAIRELEKHPAVKAYLALVESLEPDTEAVKMARAFPKKPKPIIPGKEN